jgi:hypothetical protein
MILIAELINRFVNGIVNMATVKKTTKKAQSGIRTATRSLPTGKTAVVTRTSTADGPRYYQTNTPQPSSGLFRNMNNIRNNSADSVRAKDVDPDIMRELNSQKNGGKTKAKSGKQMIKRADGSYSQRGLWDNIRAAKGSGKKPTAAMLKQERKIKLTSKKK